MVPATLVAITLTCVFWGLWTRRATWRHRWEAAATANIALLGTAVLLMSPLASATVGRGLHSLTGRWNTEDFLAHLCCIIAASSIVYTVLARLGDDHSMRVLFKRHVELPVTVCIPLLLATFWLSGATIDYRPDFLDVPTDFWLDTYWLLIGGILAYLLLYASRALLILRQDTDCRPVANFYLAAAALGVLACLVRMTTSLAPPIQAAEDGHLVRLFCCMSAIGFVLGSAYSWRIKNKAVT